MKGILGFVSRFLSRYLLGRMTRALTGLLGVSQILILHWLWAVVAGRELPGVLVSCAIGLSVFVANLSLIPLIRLRRNEPGMTHRLLGAYYTGSVAMILLGGGVGFAWLLAIPGAALAWLAGIPWHDAMAAFRILSMACVGGVALMLAWGFSYGQSRIRQEEHVLTLAGLAPALSGLRILHISDLHIGNGLGPGRLARLVALANSRAAAVIVLTGDIFDADPSVLEAGACVLDGLEAPLGVYAILGNHDAYVGTELVVDALTEHAPSVRLLRGDLVRLPGAEPFYVAGFDDPTSILWTARDIEIAELEELGDKRPDDGPTLLLIHRPELFGQARRLGFPLVLAGHTHGGQLAVPFFESPLNVARLMTRYDRGLFHEGGSTLYVNRGLGVAGPGLRIGAPREMALFELRAPNHHEPLQNQQEPVEE